MVDDTRDADVRHEELLDAAHIVADADPLGEPVVPNGLALCKMHHAAFDQNLLGVTPQYRVTVRPDVMKEKDGPTLIHVIQQMEGVRLTLPHHSNQYPDPALLSIRFEAFLQSIP